jgi:RHS repeat-associated protein
MNINRFFLFFLCFLSTALLSPAYGAITTTSSVVGESVVWSLSNTSRITCDPPVIITNTSETVYCIALINNGANTIVQVDIPHPRVLDAGTVAQRLISVSIPDAGIRWVAEKKWASNFTDPHPQPTTIELEHRARLSPYQAIPAFPDEKHQPDKRILIQDITFTYDESSRFLNIYITPEFVNKLEENGLPEYARTEPDIKLKKPYGCNGCSEIGLPGFRVNMATLLPVVEDTLYQWSGRGPAVNLAMTWNSMLPTGKTNFGKGWRFSYDSWLTEASEGVTIDLDDGGQLHFDIPTENNANVTSVTANPATGDTTVKVEYTDSVPSGEPSYTPDWDGHFPTDRSGYQLKKVLDGDTGLRTFILTPPNEKLSYIFQGSTLVTDPLPLVAVEDWNGNRLQISRNASGAITQITDAVNRTATLTYNPAGQCTTLTVPGNKQLTFGYSGANLIRSVDLIANQTNYTYNADLQITGMETSGRPWLFSWITTADDFTHLASVTDPEGGITQYAIAQPEFAFRRNRMTDATGRTFEYNYPDGQFTGNTHQQSPTIESDAKGRPVKIHQKGAYNSIFRELAYNEIGAISQIKEYDGGIHTYTYNSLGLITSYVDALNHTWQTEYDEKGNITRTISPEGRTTQHTYDSFGQRSTTTDPMGNVTTNTYDAFGNIKTVTDAEESKSTYTYSSTGIDLAGITNPLGNTTSFTYDNNRRLTRVTHPDGTYRETVYDCCASTRFRNENGDWRSITRSSSLKILSQTDYLGNAGTYSYDKAGRQTSFRDPEGKTVNTTYNELGQPTAVQNQVGDSTSWTYWSNTDTVASHTLSQQPNAITEIGMNWRATASKANGWEYVHDKMGRLWRIITPMDYWKRINFTRDADGLPTKKDFNETTTIATFARDLNGLISSSTHSLGTDTYERNARNQVTRQTWPGSLAMEFSYNQASQLASMKYPDNSTATYTHDTRGRITDISWKGHTFQTQYNAVGDITKEIRPNAINTNIGNDKNNQPISVHHYRGDETLFRLACTRNSHGLLKECVKSDETPVWSPTLTAENTASQFTYDRSFTLTSRNGQAAATDANGNQTTIPGSRNFTGSYDYQNLLTSWNAGSKTNAAIYDGLNRLIQWAQNGIVRKFHYDEHDRLLFETDGDNAITSMWLYRGKQVIAMANDDGIFCYHTDLNGNIIFLSNAGTGTVAARYDYLPFGMQTQTSSSVSNPFTYVGAFGVIDLGEGLYYMRSRTYDSHIGAFLSNDPIGMGVTTNAREYARNNPVNWIDPDGLFGFLTQYSAEGATAPRVGADFNNKIYNAPTYTYEQPRGGANDPCLIGTAWNVATSLEGNYGTGASVLQMLSKFVQGEYGDGILDGLGTALGKISGPAGAVGAFMGANSLSDDEWGDQRRLEQYMDSQTRHNVEAYDFTIPPFTLDE